MAVAISKAFRDRLLNGLRAEDVTVKLWARPTLYVFAGSIRHCKDVLDRIDFSTLGDVLVSRRLASPVEEYSLEMVTPGDVGRRLAGRHPKEGDVVIWGHFDRGISADFIEEIKRQGFA